MLLRPLMVKGQYAAVKEIESHADLFAADELPPCRRVAPYPLDHHHRLVVNVSFEQVEQLFGMADIGMQQLYPVWYGLRQRYPLTSRLPIVVVVAAHDDLWLPPICQPEIKQPQFAPQPVVRLS